MPPVRRLALILAATAIALGVAALSTEAGQAHGPTHGPATGVAHVLKAPPAGGFTVGVSGTTDKQAFADAQTFSVAIVWRFDIASQRWVSFIPEGSAIASVQTMRLLGEDDIVTVYAASMVTGTVTYREKIALTPSAVVQIMLVDVSRADAAAVVIGEQVIKGPGQAPIDFEIVYDPAKIDPSFSYAIQVRIMEGDELAFTTDTRYPVITRGSPTRVDIVLKKLGLPASKIGR
jgi:putative lipoprotein